MNPPADELYIARYINDLQFIGECWMKGFNYEEYSFHAKRLQYHEYSAASYTSQCRALDEQMADYFNDGPFNEPAEGFV